MTQGLVTNIQNQKMNVKLDVAKLNNEEYEKVKVKDEAEYTKQSGIEQRDKTEDIKLTETQQTATALNDQLSLDYSNKTIDKSNIKHPDSYRD